MESDEAPILAVNLAFYDAFNARDIERMDALWALDAPVACIHPGWDALVGREEVMESWRAILDGDGAPEVRMSDPKVHAYGDTAFVVCREELGGGALIATNVFVRERGAWKLVHHHAGPTSSRTPRRARPRPPTPQSLN